MPGLSWSASIGRPLDVQRTLDADLLAAFDERGLRKTWIFPEDLQASFKRNASYAADPYGLAEEPLRSPALNTQQRLPEPLASQLRTLVALHEDARLILAPVEVRFEPVGQAAAPSCASCSSIRACRAQRGLAKSSAIQRARSVRSSPRVLRRSSRISWLFDNGRPSPGVSHSLNGMSTHVTLIPGDGIGPSISAATTRIIEASGADITWDTQLAGLAGVARYGDPIPDSTLDSIKRTKLALKGPLETPVGEGYRSINVALRKTFDLYANVRPAYSIAPGGRYENLDLVMIRENTEGLYVGIEHYIKIGDDPRAAAESVALITRAGSGRIVRYAFDYAVKHNRKKVTLVHKRTFSNSHRDCSWIPGEWSPATMWAASNSRSASSTPCR
jgi:hypothetical protein